MRLPALVPTTGTVVVCSCAANAPVWAMMLLTTVPVATGTPKMAAYTSSVVSQPAGFSGLPAHVSNEALATVLWAWAGAANSGRAATPASRKQVSVFIERGVPGEVILDCLTKVAGVPRANAPHKQGLWPTGKPVFLVGRCYQPPRHPPGEHGNSQRSLKGGRLRVGHGHCARCTHPKASLSPNEKPETPELKYALSVV